MYLLKIIFDDILLFSTALLKENLRIIKFAHCKFTMQ